MSRKKRLNITINNSIYNLIEEIYSENDDKSKAETVEMIVIEGLKKLGKLPDDKIIILK